MTERVKVFEEKKKMAAWMWLLPLLLLLAILAFVVSRHHDTPVETAQQTAPLGVVHFDTNQAALTSEGKTTLDQVASSMKSDTNMHLRVEGYTDATGNATHNDNLSGQRAATVADYLVGHGIDRSRLNGEGFAAEKQVDTNATAQGKADNRRVELYAQH